MYTKTIKYHQMLMKYREMMFAFYVKTVYVQAFWHILTNIQAQISCNSLVSFESR